MSNHNSDLGWNSNSNTSNMSLCDGIPTPLKACYCHTTPLYRYHNNTCCKTTISWNIKHKTINCKYIYIYTTIPYLNKIH